MGTKAISPSRRKYILRLILIALLFGFISVNVSMSRTLNVNDNNLENDFIYKAPKATRIQRQSVSISLSNGTRQAISVEFGEASFLYANTTFRYRFSPSFLDQRFLRPPMVPGDTTNIPSKLLPGILFGVCSNGGKITKRQTARRTWTKDVPALFLVAGPWDQIADEFQKHQDLIWLDIGEDYRNALTPKTFGLIHFANHIYFSRMEKPPETAVQFVFKTDDDVFINATEMSVELDKYPGADYYGLLRENVQPERLGDKPSVSKWVISREDYPDDTFPPYAHGTGYALSPKFTKCAVQAMARTQHFMPWEDVATGMLAQDCHVPLTPSDQEWSHFVPFGSNESEWIQFPYHRYKDGGVLVKILHKVKPWFFEPLMHQLPLYEARAYGTKLHLEAKQRREGGGGQ